MVKCYSPFLKRGETNERPSRHMYPPNRAFWIQEQSRKVISVYSRSLPTDSITKSWNRHVILVNPSGNYREPKGEMDKIDS